jgi:hypothetical protein
VIEWEDRRPAALCSDCMTFPLPYGSQLVGLYQRYPVTGSDAWPYAGRNSCFANTPRPCATLA